MSQGTKIFESRELWLFAIAAGVMAIIVATVVANRQTAREQERLQAEFDERVANEIKIGANNLVTEIRVPACADGWSLEVPITKGWKINWSFTAKFEYKNRRVDRSWRKPPSDGRFIGEVVRFCIEDNMAAHVGAWQKFDWKRPNPDRLDFVTVPKCNHDFGNRWSKPIETRYAKAERVEWSKDWKITVARFSAKKRDWSEWRADYVEVQAGDGWSSSFRLCTDTTNYAGYAMPLTWID